MAKYIVFSFDDGRLDTYENSYQILRKFNIPATINISTDFINNPNMYDSFKSGGNLAMNWEQIIDLYINGWEVASHGNKHLNTIDDIAESLKYFHDYNLIKDKIGFASPNSKIEYVDFLKLKSSPNLNELSYIRSGLQVRREGILYSSLTSIYNITKYSKLFCILNLKCKISLKPDINEYPVLSVGITSKVTLKSIISLLKTLKDDECYILMFHSILKKSQKNYKVDKWWWDYDDFRKLCELISENKEYIVITTKQLIEYSKNRGV